MELVNGLPEACFAEHPATGEVIAIKRGESGYHATTIDYATSREVNEKLGISEAQEMAMLSGSIVGWDNPGADPATWEDLPETVIEPREKELVLCPRCEKITLHPETVRNSLSRRDNETYICNGCGMDEALDEWAWRG